MEFNGVEAKIAFEIKAVESIPCELRKQTVAFSAENKRVSDKLNTPWPMPWIEEELGKLASGENTMPDEDLFRVYNPEEPDQYVVVEVHR